ncbi:hypothetical protein [Altibacter sp. HG106]|uniref:hypothetical protein n=1 Tax=Altibacter sp. HG106 TaxID=3023937 RepID=UPI002350E092|nr:hypothetical protein [Altibacter sp. HG106]MDC7993838.1 hypothetical protein [Altibacter sp. HG106]
MQEAIRFKKQRDLGAILTDTFKFIRLEWRSLFSLILRLAGPALLLVVLAYIFYMQSTLGSIGVLDPYNSGTLGVTVLLALGTLVIAAIIYYALLYGTILHYIKSYIENDGIVDIPVVKARVRQSFWSLIGLNLLIGLIVGVGLVFCFIPGIYLGTVLASGFAVLIFERRDVTDTISYCFDLIKNEWWMTFATFLVLGILYYIIAIIFQVPQYIYFFIKGFAMAEEFSGSDPSSMFDWVYMSLSTVGMIANYLLQSILIIGTVFVYFNLNEKKHFSGTMETIDQLGQDTTNHHA